MINREIINFNNQEDQKGHPSIHEKLKSTLQVIEGEEIAKNLQSHYLKEHYNAFENYRIGEKLLQISSKTYGFTDNHKC